MKYSQYSIVTVFTLFMAAALTATSVQAHALTSFGQKRLEKLKTKQRSERWTFEVGPNPALDEDLENLTGLVTPNDWKKGATFRHNDPLYPELGVCFGERVASPTSNYGFFWNDEAIPRGCVCLDRSAHICLADCKKISKR